MNKTALITGITGQDGSYLAEFLLEKGYNVYGLFRRGSTNTSARIAHLLDQMLSATAMQVRTWYSRTVYLMAIYMVFTSMAVLTM